jgi:glycosyltransferase involved in cell wall biosynthesis
MHSGESTVNIGIALQGGVDRSEEYRVIPVLLGLIGKLTSRHHVRVLAMNQEPRPGRWQLRGAEVINIGSTHALHRGVAELLAQHRARPFDVLHALWTGPSGLVAAIAARMLRVPMLVHLTGGELVSLPEIGYGQMYRLRWRVLNRWILRAATCITATSDPMVALAIQAGFPATRVPLGVDLDDWPVRPPQPRNPASPARLIQVASLNRVKHHSMTLEALRLLRARNRAVVADFVGEDTLSGSVQALARQLGLEDVVRFHGFRTQRQLRPLIEMAHINVVSSLHEAGPAAALEAAVAGVPTVGSRVGHLSEWHPRAALTVKPGDAESLAEQIERLLDDDELRQQIASSAQARAIEEDASHTAARFEALYAEAMSAHSCDSKVASGKPPS